MFSFPSFLKPLRRFDWILFSAILVLAAISFSTLYSIDLSRGGVLRYFSTQIIAFAIGMIALFVGANLHVTWYSSAGRFIYLLGLGLLATVLFVGSTVRGTRGWFPIGNFSFQPAEFAKFTLVIVLGLLSERYGRKHGSAVFLVVSFVITLTLAGLIMLQPDLGSSLVLLGTWFGILCFTNTRRLYIFAIIMAAVLVALTSWRFYLKDYQKERVLTFLNPERDPMKSGYNVTQSIVAVGAGQFFGRGLGRGSQSQLHFLPEAQTDFIFSVISEELGFFGAGLVILLFFVIIWRLLFIARRANSDFAAYMVLGIALVFMAQIVLNTGGALGLLPMTGVTLPFVSYGGSSLIINLMMIGLAESVYRSTF
jgi:rod shape determining protein RodA